jgi:dsDNA-binding SOS-regulon protein
MLDLSSNLDVAMQQAAEYLKEQYPEIHEMWLSAKV